MNNDCLTIVLLYLNIKDIVRCTLLNRRFNHLIHRDLWPKLCQRDYPEYHTELRQDTYQNTYALCYGLAMLRLYADKPIRINELYKLTNITVDPNRDRYHDHNACLETSIFNDWYHSNDITLSKSIKEIALLKNLTTLEITNGCMIPKEVLNMINLRSLILDYNRMITIPKNIYQLSNLMELSLERNKLQKLPAEIGQLVSLRKLYVNHNRLTELPSEIGKLVNLEVFAFETNNITELPPEIGNLINLTYLSFNNNKITVLPLEITKLTKLDILSGINNAIKDVPVEISRMHTLKKCHI